MKNLVKKFSTWAFLVGLFFTAFGLLDIFQERNVGQKPVEMTIDSVVDPADELIYASINGGRLDLSNAYEYSLSTKKSDVKLTSDFFIPVFKNEERKVIYILKTALEPTISDMAKAPTYQGLLKSKNELPSKILDAYNGKFNNDNFYFLDSTYDPKTILEKLLGLKFFIGLLIIGLVVRFLVGKKAIPSA
ncbi:MAG: hypothetical protein P8X89_06745 [Reinekea sp.]